MKAGARSVLAPLMYVEPAATRSAGGPVIQHSTVRVPADRPE